MQSARLRTNMPTEAAMNPPEDILIDLGTALVAFGTALQLAGTRLQANQLQTVSPQAAAPVPSAPIINRLPKEGFVRIWDIIGRKAVNGWPAIAGMIPVSRSTWYAGIKSGRFPKPINHHGIAMWCVEDIQALVAQLGR